MNKIFFTTRITAVFSSRKKEVMKMDNSGWPKKCLKEEIREIINETKWGKELRGTTSLTA